MMLAIRITLPAKNLRGKDGSAPLRKWKIMNDKTSPEDFYKQQRDILHSVDGLPDMLDKIVAKRLSVHEARLDERLKTTERSVVAMVAVCAVIGAAIVAIAM